MKNLYTLLLLFFVSINVTNAQSGVLDPSFGNNGIVLTEISPNNNYGEAVAVQADGKIVVAGYAGAPATYRMAVARYNTDGSLDNSFGSNGTLNFQVGAAKSYVTAMKIQADGKIVLAGYTWDNVSGDMALVRLNQDGSFDNSFGNNGITIIDAGGNEIAEAMTILDDGKILLAGNNDDSFSIARFNTDGSLDSSFGANGWSIIMFDQGGSFVKDLAMQDDGKVLLAGFLFNATNFIYEMAAARINVDGSSDNSFGTNGKVHFNIGNGNDFAEGIAVQADGKIVLGGHKWIANAQQRHDFAAVRLNTNGEFDTSYGNGGVATAQIVDGANYTRQMLLQPDNKAVLVGFTVLNGVYDIAMVRFDTDGNLDSTFGTDGMVSTDIDTREDYANAITLQADDKILLTGYSYTPAGDASIFVARYNNAPLSIGDNLALEFRVYPNPTSDQLTLELNDASSTYQIEIFDILGKKVISSEIQKVGTIDVSSLTSGTYLLKFNSDYKTNVVRFVKK